MIRKEEVKIQVPDNQIREKKIQFPDKKSGRYTFQIREVKEQVPDKRSEDTYSGEMFCPCY